METKIITSSYFDTSPPFSFLASSYTTKPPIWGEEGASNPRPVVEEVGFIESTQNFMSFMSDIRENGLSHAIYGKPFSQVMADFFKELFHDIGTGLLANADLFFLAPAIFLMFMTFFVGRNKYTKFILPLWFTYAICTMFYKML